MKDLLNKKYLYFIAAVIAVSICTIICLFVNKNNINEDISYVETNSFEVQNNNIDENKTNDKKIFVHIAGEVMNEGLIEAEYGDRIKDVIDRAGGITELADISKVNLAYQVEDGQKIIIPNINDEDKQSNYIFYNGGENIVENDQNYNEKVNINTATQTELEMLNGIGPSIASKIISYRNENGKFKSIDELKNVPGVGSSKFEGIKSKIIAK